MLAIGDPEMALKLKVDREANAAQVIAKDEALQDKLAKQ